MHRAHRIIGNEYLVDSTIYIIPAAGKIEKLMSAGVKIFRLKGRCCFVVVRGIALNNPGRLSSQNRQPSITAGRAKLQSLAN